MAKLVLGLGIFMSVAGAYAIVTGYPIVQIERGWASVIAGAALVSGGGVMVSIGLVIRAIRSLENSLTLRSPAGPFEPSPEVETTRDAIAATAAGHALTPVVPAAPEPSIPAAELPKDLADEPERPERGETADASSERPETPVASVTDSAADEPKSITENGTTARHEEIDALGDWLDQEFAAFDRTARRTPPTKADLEPPSPEPKAMEASDAPASPDPAIAAEPEQHSIEDGADEAPATAPSAPTEAAPAVIGRYESDGTSYVMYADGSIEAQSANGVYRFASMAELKAFIES